MKQETIKTQKTMETKTIYLNESINVRVTFPNNIVEHIKKELEINDFDFDVIDKSMTATMFEIKIDFRISTLKTLFDVINK